MSDNILTALRVRPLNTNETTDKCRVIVDTEEKQYDGSLVIVDPIFFETNGVNRRPYEQQFNLDYSFWSVASQTNSTSQEELYIKCGEPLMQSCLDGLNCSIIAHGQTGSGKTYTMAGTNSPSRNEIGIIPRFCKGLLSAVQETIGSRNSNCSSISSIEVHQVLSIELSLSYYEIYNEIVHDLLSTNSEVSSIVTESKEGSAMIENLCLRKFDSYDDVATALEEGNKRRSIAATQKKSIRSRSHTVFTVYVNQKLTVIPSDGPASPSIIPTNSTITRLSKVCMVDLAGSERSNLTGTSEEKLTEANNINKSLSTLNDIISTLSSDRETIEAHLPYRNSMLTWLLQDYLRNNSKTVLIGTISPTELTYTESINTLRYVERAKHVRINEKMNGSSLEKNYILELQNQIQGLPIAKEKKNGQYVRTGSEFLNQLEVGTSSSVTTDGTECHTPPERVGSVDETSNGSESSESLSKGNSQCYTNARGTPGKGNADLETLQDELLSKSSELALFKAESAEIIAQYKDMLYHARQSADAMRREKDCEIDGLADELVASKKSLRITQGTVDPTRFQNELSPNPSELHIEISRLKEQNKIQNDNLIAAEEERDSLREFVTTKLTVLESHQNTMQQDKSIKKSETDTSALIEEISELKNKNSALQQEIENQKNQLSDSELNMMNKIKEMSAEKIKLETAANNLKQECDTYKSQNEEFTKVSAALKESKKEFDDHVNSLTREKTILEGLLEKERDRVSAFTAAAVVSEEEAQRERTKFENEIENLHKKIESLGIKSEGKNENMKSRSFEVEEDKETCQNIVKSKVEDMKASQMEKKEIESELQKLKTSVQNSIDIVRHMLKENMREEDVSKFENINLEGSDEALAPISSLSTCLDKAISDIKISYDGMYEELLQTENKLKEIEGSNTTKKTNNIDNKNDDQDSTRLGQLLAEAKIEIAMQKCENEDLQQTYRKLEKQTCALKLSIASMQEERDDMMAMKMHVDALLSKSTEVLLRR